MRIKVIGRVRPQIDRERQLREEVVTYISSSLESNDPTSKRQKESIKTDISIQARNTMAPKLYRLDGVLDGNNFTFSNCFLPCVTTSTCSYREFNASRSI